MLFGITALLVVGASWCLVGIVLGRAPRDGLDTGIIQLLGACVSIAASITIATCFLPPGACPAEVLFRTCGIYFAAGIFNYFGLQAMAEGMRRGPNGSVWGIMQSAMVFPFLAGILFFGVALTLPRTLGILALLGAIPLFSMAKNSKNQKEGEEKNDSAHEENGKWRFWAFLSLALIAIQQNLATAPSYDPEAREVSPILRAASTASGTLAAFFLQTVFQKIRRGESFLVFLGKIKGSISRPRLWVYVLSMQFFSLIFAYTLLYPGLDAMGKAGAGAVSYPLMVGSCIVSFTLYSALVLREKLSWTQMAALVFCLGGLAGLCFPSP